MTVIIQERDNPPDWSEAQAFKIIGIDLAPSKQSHVFDGQSMQIMDQSGLQQYLAKLIEAKANVLICWDAPLTGPSGPDASEIQKRHFSTRPVESFFMTKKWGFRTPKGISVLGYSGCPHWAVSRNLIGLPRVSQFDTHWRDLPFRLWAQDPPPCTPGRFITEVHPALALWLWFRGKMEDDFDWQYKKNARSREMLWAALKLKIIERGLKPKMQQWTGVEEPLDDDELDAITAWFLGYLWGGGPENVGVLGDLRMGFFLVPLGHNVLGALNSYKASLPPIYNEPVIQEHLWLGDDRWK